MLSDEQFTQNVTQWSRYNPIVSGNVYASAKRISFRTNPNGTLNLAATLGDREVFLHAEDPIAEAKKWFLNLSLTDVEVLVVYGIGLGYCYEAIKEWLHSDPSRFLILLEDDYEVIRHLLFTERGTEILADKQVWPFFADEQGLAYRIFVSTLVLKPYLFAASNSYLRWWPARVEKVQAHLAHYLTIRIASPDEYRNGGSAFFSNFFRNLLLAPSAYNGNALYGKFKDIPAIICGAGPSLANNLHLLPGLRQRALIFAGGTAMNAVNSNDFIPHFGVGLDPNPPQVTRLIMNKAYTVPYFYRTRLQHEALKLIQGERLYTTGSSGYYIGRWFDEQMGLAGVDLNEGYNVTNLSVSIAWAMGCNPIIFTGLDLSYPETGSYCPGVINHPLHDRQEYFRTKSSSEELINRVDINGNPVWTQWKWIAEATWLIQFAKLNPNITFINASEGGLGFTGIPNIPLEEVAHRFLTDTYDLSGAVHRAIQNAPMPELVTQTHIVTLIQSLRDSLMRCREMLKRAELTSIIHEIGYRHLLKGFEEANLSESSQEVLLAAIDSIVMQMDHALMTKPKGYDRRSHRSGSPFGEMIPKRPEDFQGHSNFYSVDGQILSKTYFEQGFPHGEARTWYASGSTHSLQHFSHGVWDGPQVYYYESGAVKSKLHYLAGKLDGTVELFYPSGTAMRTVHFIKGKRHGSERIWGEQGQLMIEAEFNMDCPMGTARQWHPNGVLAKEVMYEQDGVHYTTKEWHDNGVLKEIEEGTGDYFDQVASHTGQLTKAIEQLLTQVVSPLVEQNKDQIGELDKLHQELQHLNDLHQKLRFESGLEPGSLEESIWKGPKTQKHMERLIDHLNAPIQGQLEEIQDKMRLAIERLSKKVDSDQSDKPH